MTSSPHEKAIVQNVKMSREKNRKFVHLKNPVSVQFLPARLDCLKEEGWALKSVLVSFWIRRRGGGQKKQTILISDRVKKTARSGNGSVFIL